jgi:hypothetical protein
MSTNPYAPPSATVADIPDTASTVEPIFFPVSVLKLGVLSTCTLGLYQVYWFYQHWRRLKEREGYQCNPALRAIFSVFYCYPLFGRIRESGGKLGVAGSLVAGPLATAWILTSLTHRLPEPYWLVTYLSVLFLLPAQAYANRVNEAVTPGHDPNARFSAWNWIAVVIGGGFFVLILIGSFMPEVAA